jgi:hypothetical protein
VKNGQKMGKKRVETGQKQGDFDVKEDFTGRKKF